MRNSTLCDRAQPAPNGTGHGYSLDYLKFKGCERVISHSEFRLAVFLEVGTPDHG